MNKGLQEHLDINFAFIKWAKENNYNDDSLRYGKEYPYDILASAFRAGYIEAKGSETTIVLDDSNFRHEIPKVYKVKRTSSIHSQIVRDLFKTYPFDFNISLEERLEDHYKDKQ